MGKHFSKQIKNRWVKSWSAADRKADVYARFALANINRYKRPSDRRLQQVKNWASMAWRYWVKHYNRDVVGMENNKKAFAKRGRKRKVKLNPSKLDPRVVGVFIEILEEVLNRRALPAKTLLSQPAE